MESSCYAEGRDRGKRHISLREANHKSNVLRTSRRPSLFTGSSVFVGGVVEVAAAWESGLGPSLLLPLASVATVGSE